MEDKEKLLELYKKFLLVLKTSKNPQTIERVSKDLARVKKELEKYYPDGIPEEELFPSLKKSKEDSDKVELKIIPEIEIEEVSPYKGDREINLAISLLKEFDNELWIALSNMHTKLDFNFSSRRDAFYPVLERIRKNIDNYKDIIQSMEKTTNEKYRESLEQMKSRYERAILTEIHSFFKNFLEFIEKLIDDLSEGGGGVLNPEDIINFPPYEGKKKLQGFKVKDAIFYIRDFLKETLEVIKIPEIK